jgi:hypothetical protein
LKLILISLNIAHLPRAGGEDSNQIIKEGGIDED